MKGNEAFFDTNILVYAFDKTDLPKWRMAKSLVDDLTSSSSTRPWISMQVVNEFTNVVFGRIRNPIDPAVLESILADFEKSFNIATLSVRLTNTACRLRLSHGFSFWDSMIVASALESKCSILYTEDMQDGQLVDRRLRIENPFK